MYSAEPSKSDYDLSISLASVIKEDHNYLGLTKAFHYLILLLFVFYHFELPFEERQ